MAAEFKVGDKVRIYYAGYLVGVAGKPETEIHTITKIGRKWIHLDNGSRVLVDPDSDFWMFTIKHI